METEKVNMSEQEREKKIYRVTILGSILNFVLLAFKFAAGILGHSAAMIADAVHSLSDFFTDIIVLIFVRISSRPQDKSHDYGHGKFETLATVIVAVVLLLVGVGIFWGGAKSIYFCIQGGQLPAPEPIALWAAIISIVSKELLYQYTAIVGRKVKSTVVIANAWHHRSDAFSSIGTAIGIGGAIFLGDKWHILDPIAAVVVSIFIVKVSIQLLRPCLNDLLESSLPDEVEQDILDTVSSFPGVNAPHDLRTRRIGNDYAIEMHILMNGDLPLRTAHDTATAIEIKLREKYGANTHITLHLEPIEEHA